MNYSNMSLEDLRKERTRIERAIAGKEKKSKQEATAKIAAIAKDAGIDLAELKKSSGRKAVGAKDRGRPGVKRGKVPPKYRNPKDSTSTWTGRGRKPVWVREHLENGGSLESITI